MTSLIVTDEADHQIYVTNGTTTRVIATSTTAPPVLDDPVTGNPVEVIASGNVTYLVMADPGGVTSSLYRYDGTTIVKVSAPELYVSSQYDYNQSNAPSLVAFNGKIIFSQESIDDANALYGKGASLAVYDPVTNSIGSPIVPNGGLDPMGFTVVGSVLYFIGRDTTTNQGAIYAYNGTTVSEVMSTQNATGAIAAFNGNLYFGSTSSSVYRYDLSSKNTSVVATLDANNPNLSSNNFIVFNNRLYASSPTVGVTSFSTANTPSQFVTSIGAQSFNPVVYDNKLYYTSYYYVQGAQFLMPGLFVSSDGLSSTMLKANTNAQDFVVANNVLNFVDFSSGQNFTYNGVIFQTVSFAGASGSVTPVAVAPFGVPASTWTSGLTPLVSAFPLDETTLPYSATDETVFVVSASGGTLDIIDTAKGNVVVASIGVAGAHTGGIFTLASDGGSGTTVSFTSTPSIGTLAGDIVLANINGGSAFATVDRYTSTGGYADAIYTYDRSGQLIAARYTGVTGQPYQAFETDYSDGTNTQTQYFYTGVTGQSYTTETLTVNAAGQQTAVAFGGLTGAPYASYEYDYNAGLLAGSKFTYTAVPAGATYSSYETDYNFANSYLGARFFYTNITGQPYTGEEVDTTAAGATTKVVLTGYSGQPYQTLELDYTGGAYTGYKTFATGITGQSYTGLEEDVTAAGQLTKVVYTGLKGTPYTTLEQDYTGGALANSIYTFNGTAGQSYSSYAITQNASGTQISETVNNTNGSHTIVGSANNLIFEAIGNDKIKGGGSGETFDFSTVFGHDTITDFSGHTTGTGHDTISLSSADFSSFAAVSASAQNVTGGVAFTGKSGSTITLNGLDKITLAGLGGDFTFHA